ncbi:winged helix-turn-helix domain-containing protein [Shewanella sedimentimangrovi]|uniref:Winged helix-turn-helix domain-containing protein n=1 Tax=Shewanella sedimentimangrovi TaxID=2814293 RepID=A0ABX7R1T1_9GAMM|nr:winged helix-turn-helix domain-containing protein [Shewanella sedimentimangrovi]QSX37771.1 winged helix-turn-helix domain-containing protein [Shewanella sedimentimangrovi]
MFNNKKYRIGDYLIIPERCLIIRDGNESKLELRVMQVLVCLLERAGRPVSRDELIQEVWRGGIVSDNAINRIIGILRTSLGDDARTQTVIKTLPKVGYLLVSDTLQPLTMKLLSESELASDETVTLGGDVSSLTQDGSSVPSEPENRFRNRPNKYVIGAAFLLSLLTCWYWLIPFVSSLQSNNHVADNIVTLVPLTSLDGQEVDPVLSPDSKKLAFSYRERDGTFWRVMTQDIATGTINFIESSPEPGMNQRYPAWSNDGGHLAFLNYDGQKRCEVVLLDMLTRTRKVLANCHTALQSSAIAFSGKDLIFIDTEGLDEYKKMFRINIESLRREQLSQPINIGRGDYGLTLSPDGDKLAVLRNVGWFDTLVMEFEFSSGEWQQLFKVGYPLKSVAWDEQGQGIIYRAEEGQLHRYDLRDHKVTRLTKFAQEINSPRSNGAGQVTAVIGELVEEEMWFWRSPKSTSSQPETWISSNRRDFRGSISPNGQLTIFVSNRTGLPQIWLKYNSGEEKQITSFSNFAHVDELSFFSDSQYICGVINGKPFVMNVDDGVINYIPGVNSARNVSFGMSKSELVALVFDGGKRQILLLDVQSGQVKKLLAADAFSGKYDRTDGVFYFSKMHSKGIWMMNNGVTTKVTEAFTPFFSYGWHIANGTIWYLDSDGDNSFLVELSVTSGGSQRYKIDVKNLSTSIMSMTDQADVLLSVLANANTDVVFVDVKQ